jgi:uncharacterized membrane protein (UPF0182 family)
VLNGNLLTLPVGDGLLYVQPVYIRRTGGEGTYPVLQFVAASFGDDVGFGQTLDEALRVALGLEPGSAPDEETGGETGGDGGGDTAKSPSELLAEASDRYNEAQDALKEGDLATYQRKINEMNDRIKDAQQALEQ